MPRKRASSQVSPVVQDFGLQPGEKVYIRSLYSGRDLAGVFRYTGPGPVYGHEPYATVTRREAGHPVSYLVSYSRLSRSRWTLTPRARRNQRRRVSADDTGAPGA